LTGNDQVSSAPGETIFELSDIKVLSADRASFYYNLSKATDEEREKSFDQNSIYIAEFVVPEKQYNGELHLMEIDKKEPKMFPVKIYNESSDTVDDKNAILMSTNIPNTGHYHEHLNRLESTLKVERNNHIFTPVFLKSNRTALSASSSIEMNQYYDRLIRLVKEAGRSGVSTDKVVKLLNDELKKQINTESLNSIIIRGVEEKKLFQIYDFISDDQEHKVSLLIDIKHERLYRVNDDEDGTCPWITNGGNLNATFYMKLKANMTALLTNSPGANFTLLHAYFPYLTIYQMEILLKRLVKENFIYERNDAKSIRLQNPFDNDRYDTKPCYFLTI
jgi:hypothetical protein